MNLFLSKSNIEVLKDFFKINFYILIIVNFGNLAQIFYQFFGGKVLKPENFGLLGSVNSIIGLVSLPLAIFFNFALKFFIEKKNKLNSNQFQKIFNLLNSYVFYFAIIFFLIIIAMKDFFYYLINVEDFNIVILISITIFFNFITLPFIAINQIYKRYKFVSAIGSIHHYLRFLFFVFFYYFVTKSYLSGLLANAISFFIIFIILYFSLRNIIEIELIIDLKKFYNFFFFSKVKKSLLSIKSSIISTFFLTVITSIDIVIFRKVFPDELSGYYNAISTLGKIPLFLSAITFAYFLTESTYNFVNKNKSRTILITNLLINFLIFLFFIIIYYFYGSEVITFLFNKNYSSFSSELFFLTIAMTFVGFIKIIILHLFSQNDNGYALISIVALIIILLLCFFSVSHYQFIFTMIYGYLLMLIYLSIYLMTKKN